MPVIELVNGVAFLPLLEDLKIKNPPLYRIVSKLGAARFGSRYVFFEKSQVPSPTVMVSEL